jgi:hypothetical protein
MESGARPGHRAGSAAVKRKAWKIVLGVLGSMLLILSLIVADVHRRASAVLDRNRAVLETEIAAFRSRDHTRKSPFLETTDGNAWDHYGPALKVIGNIPNEIADLVPEIQGLTDEGEEPSPDDHALHTLFREYESTLAAFEKGARCRIVNAPAFAFRPDGEIPYPSESLRASRFLSGAVHHLHRMGSDPKAVSLALSGMAFGQDIGRNGLLVHSLVATVVDGILVSSLRDVLEDHALPAADLSALAAGLDRLEASRPDVLDCWDGEMVYLRSSLLEAPWAAFFQPFSIGLPSPPKPQLPPWRFLFSEQITRAHALSHVPELFSGLPDLRPLPPWQRPASAPDPVPVVLRLKNPLLAVLTPVIRRPLENDARSQLGRTLLRNAVAIAWFEVEKGGYPDRLEELVPRYLPKVSVCPMTGQPLRYSYKGGKVWSVGKNGIDDGGTPGRNNDADDEDGDVVWVVRRRK